jgi:large subunit ribosomal protein L29
MKTKELKELSDKELSARRHELTQELFHLRIQKAGGQVEKPSQLKEIRKEMARVETFLSVHRIAKGKAPAAGASAKKK